MIFWMRRNVFIDLTGGRPAGRVGDYLDCHTGTAEEQVTPSSHQTVIGLDGRCSSWCSSARYFLIELPLVRKHITHFIDSGLNLLFMNRMGCSRRINWLAPYSSKMPASSNSSIRCLIRNISSAEIQRYRAPELLLAGQYIYLPIILILDPLLGSMCWSIM